MEGAVLIEQKKLGGIMNEVKSSTDSMQLDKRPLEA